MLTRSAAEKCLKRDLYIVVAIVMVCLLVIVLCALFAGQADGLHARESSEEINSTRQNVDDTRLNRNTGTVLGQKGEHTPRPVAGWLHNESKILKTNYRMH